MRADIKSEGGLRCPKLLLCRSRYPKFRRRGFFPSRTQGKIPENPPLIATRVVRFPKTHLAQVACALTR